jgi:hypothetical protein
LPFYKFIHMKKIFASVLFVVATCTMSCSQTPAASDENKAFGPAIEFKDTEHDFGTIQQGGDGAYSFVFTNTGTDPLILSNVRSSCGCTIPEWPHEPINAGQSSAILVKYDTKRIGAFNKSISVYSNAGGEAPIVLHIKGTVEATAAAATE